MAQLVCAFGLGDSHFEIDLNAAHRGSWKASSPSSSSRLASSAGGKRGRQAKPVRKAVDRDRTYDIRQWAKETGLTVSERGRISRQEREAYDAAR